MERSVRRSELRSVESTPRPPLDTDVVEKLKNLASFEFTFHGNQNPDDFEEHAPGELDFRLFSTKKLPKAAHQPETVQRIRLRSPSVEIRDPGFLQPDRDRSYYFTDAPSAKEKERFQAAALTAQEVLDRSHQHWPGSAYPWKVIHIPSSSVSRSIRLQGPLLFVKLVTDEVTAKRRTPGKKARIKIRTKLAASHARKAEAEKASELREAAEREKRTQRNREKKVKKKMRDKAKRMENQLKPPAGD